MPKQLSGCGIKTRSPTHIFRIWITTDGRVAYDASTWSAAFRAEIQHLAAGEYTQDDFIYAIQLGNGALSWAHVTLQIAGVNDVPVATASVNSAIEGGALVTGQVKATDVDHGAILTYGLLNPVPAGLQLTAGGTYTFDPTVPAYDHLAAGATETWWPTSEPRPTRTCAPSSLSAPRTTAGPTTVPLATDARALR